MNKFFSILASVAVLVTSAVAQLDLPDIPPGGTVEIHTSSPENPVGDLCIGAVADTAQSEILLEPCSRNFTKFAVPNGQNNTQIVVEGTVSGQPQLCITAAQSLAGNTPVILQTCGSDPFQRWNLTGAQQGEGIGPIVSTAQTAGCLTAVGFNQGDPVEFHPCTDAANQQWFTIVDN